MPQSPSFPLSRDMLDAQLSTITFVEAMFPSPGEIEIPHITSRVLDYFAKWVDSERAPPPGVLPSTISIAVNLAVDETGTNIIQLNITVPLQSSEKDPIQPPPPSCSLRQPTWLSKAEVADLMSGMPKSDILEAYEYLREHAPRYLQPTILTPSSQPSTTEPLIRVWFYFPSLSTRSKRDDLVNYAPTYQLTGFVLAGKPGVLCLEGTSTSIDAYMKFIKTDSWGDIPSYQKKVSERLREGSGVGDVSVQRVFTGMQEITDSLGERGGARGNRGDMQALENWLKERGLGDAFEKVIFQ